MCVDAFAGAGGLSLGLEQAGFKPIFAFDNDPVAVDTYRANVAETAERIDATHLKGGDIKNAARLRTRRLDLLAGGPPCQGFSLQRRGQREDSRNVLVLRYLDWLTELMPRSFLIENVASITSVRGRAMLDAVRLLAADLGYRTHLRVINAADYGLPQQRRRAFLVGLDTEAAASFEWPQPTVTDGKYRTVRDAIGDLPSPPADGCPHPAFPNHYREARLSRLNVERIKHVPEGGGRLDIPSHLQLKCHQGTHRHLDVYGRLSWDKPSGTITARFDSFTRGRFGHPEEHRSLTLREGARLQGFPDWFVLGGNREDGARLVGNAVPPPMAFHVGRAIRSALKASSQFSAPSRAESELGSAERTA
jgi:DNA (cytosine-5)-methyltransferase 1